MKPLEPVDARARVEEVLQQMIDQEAKKLTSVKRSLARQNVDDTESPRPKRVHLEVMPGDLVESTSAASIMDEVRDIGVAAALEASPVVLEEDYATDAEAVLEASIAVTVDEAYAIGVPAETEALPN